MRQRISWLVLSAQALAIAVGSGVAASSAEATAVVAGTVGVRVGPPPRPCCAGGPWRPGWGWGASWRWGPGWGWGWGPGWAVAPAWAWSAPPPVWVMPSWVPSAVTVAPPLFDEQRPAVPPAPQAQAVPQAQGHWYYCTEPAGYYPYVDTCMRPWIAVQPTPR